MYKLEEIFAIKCKENEELTNRVHRDRDQDHPLFLFAFPSKKLRHVAQIQAEKSKGYMILRNFTNTAIKNSCVQEWEITIHLNKSSKMWIDKAPDHHP